ncbi:hypothetical protein [Acaryochloris sp. CCMEE 5410]|uniref:hypothetical protein n=1 Tax=Acaryochloris sp. CCMEE 5410 TaxID=310037 RepID=UPI0002484932|nr:hypothetical protein [Acaryochloris sp. CCMEE 5410]KAI9129006.1 hypothetical protein ON05_037205 [Acaryochloris sp. CCMEE 5410]
MKVIRTIQAGVINIGYSVGKDLVDLCEGLLHRRCSVLSLCKKLCVVLFTQLLIQMLAVFSIVTLYLCWHFFVARIDAVPLEVFYARTETAPDFLGHFVAFYMMFFDVSAILVYQQIRPE